jgi:hypothetical protein
MAVGLPLSFWIFNSKRNPIADWIYSSYFIAKSGMANVLKSLSLPGSFAPSAGKAVP